MSGSPVFIDDFLSWDALYDSRGGPLDRRIPAFLSAIVPGVPTHRSERLRPRRNSPPARLGSLRRRPCNQAAGLIERIFTDHQRGIVVWLTGLSSAGKSTIAAELLDRMHAAGHRVEMLDGDIIRQRLSKDLGFSKPDRDENIRRIGFVAELLAKNGVTVIVAAISPYRAVRDEVRSRIPGFVEVYVNAPLDVCEHRDVKGLYRKARAGILHGFTGIDDPYEPPLQPEIECRTDLETVEESVQRILDWLRITEPG
jgi:adenylylsulfate kinase